MGHGYLSSCGRVSIKRTLDRLRNGNSTRNLLSQSPSRTPYRNAHRQADKAVRLAHGLAGESFAFFVVVLPLSRLSANQTGPHDAVHVSQLFGSETGGAHIDYPFRDGLFSDSSSILDLAPRQGVS
jgi:hypothetical protein